METYGKSVLDCVKSAFVSPFKRHTTGMLIGFVVFFAQACSLSFEPPRVVRDDR